MLSDMIKLVQHDRVIVAAGFIDLAQRRNNGVVIGPEIAAGQDTGGMHRHRLDHDHAGAPLGALDVIGLGSPRRQPVLGHVVGMGTKHDAVFQPLVVDGNWGKQMRIGIAHENITFRLPLKINL